MALHGQENSAARLIESRELTAEALAPACLERIAVRDDAVRAWAFIHAKQTLAEARELDRTPRRSRLHGVPFGIKDIIDSESLPTEYGSPIYRGYHPRADVALLAHLLRRLAVSECVRVAAPDTRSGCEWPCGQRGS